MSESLRLEYDDHGMRGSSRGGVQQHMFDGDLQLECLSRNTDGEVRYEGRFLQ